MHLSPNNGYYYIVISSTSGQSIIDSNTFVSDSGNTRCRFIIITNITVNSGTLQGNLIVSNNNQDNSSPFTLRHLLVIEEFVGTNFGLFLLSNTTVNEGNVPVLLFNANFNIFKFIEVIGNSVQNTAERALSELIRVLPVKHLFSVRVIQLQTNFSLQDGLLQLYQLVLLSDIIQQ